MKLKNYVRVARLAAGASLLIGLGFSGVFSL